MTQSTEHAASTANLHKEISRLRHELKTSKESHPASSERIRVGDYLLERLIQLGVTVGCPSQDTHRQYLIFELPLDRPSSVFQEISTSVSMFSSLPTVADG